MPHINSALKSKDYGLNEEAPLDFRPLDEGGKNLSTPRIEPS